MFDSVYADCPTCGASVEFQTKAGECFMRSYTLDSAPTLLLLDIMNDPHWCEGCMSWFALVDPAHPPGPPPRPSPRCARVRDPMDGEYSVYKHNPNHLRWWDAPFTLDDLAQAMGARQGQDRDGLGATPASAVPQGCAQGDTP